MNRCRQRGKNASKTISSRLKKRESRSKHAGVEVERLALGVKVVLVGGPLATL